jgi:Uma2 family endonuclease
MLQRATTKTDYEVEEYPKQVLGNKKRKKMLQALAPAHEYTVEEYLQFEETSQDKHEFYRGEIYLMAGGTSEHNLVANNTSAELRGAIKRKGKDCKAYGSDMRIAIPKEEFYTYGDAVVICGELEYVSGRRDIIKNPILIAEVLSPSTRKHDRTTKFDLYSRLESFQHYLLIEPERVEIEYRWKTDDGKWKNHKITDINETLRIVGIDLEIPVAEIYWGINL